MSFRQNLTRYLLRFVTEEEGQSTTEYVLILAVVVMIAMKFRTTFGSKMEGIVTKLTGSIDTQITETIGQ